MHMIIIIIIILTIIMIMIGICMIDRISIIVLCMIVGINCGLWIGTMWWYVDSHEVTHQIEMFQSITYNPSTSAYVLLFLL